MRNLILTVAALAAFLPAQVGDATLTELEAQKRALEQQVAQAQAVAKVKAEMVELKKALADAKKGKVATTPVKRSTAKKPAKKSAPKTKAGVFVVGFPLLRAREVGVIRDRDRASIWWYVECREGGRRGMHSFDTKNAAEKWAQDVAGKFGYRFIDAVTLSNRERASAGRVGSR